MNHNWNFDAVWANPEALLAGAAGTLRIFAICLVLGLSLGLLVGLGRYAKRKWIYLPASAFVEFFRNTPVLVQILWFYFALPMRSLRGNRRRRGGRWLPRRPRPFRAAAG